MNLKKRIFSLLLTLVMLVSLVSPVLAATTYEIEIVVSCSTFDLQKSDGSTVASNNGEWSGTFDDTQAGQTVQAALGITDIINVVNKHNSQANTTRSIDGWEVYRLVNGSHELVTTLGNAGDIFTYTLPAEYIQFSAVWSDDDYNYHSDVLFSPFYGKFTNTSGNEITGRGVSRTGGKQCEGEAVNVVVNNDNTLVGDVFGDFEGWVKVTFNGRDDAETDFVVDTNSGNLYSFVDLASHIVPAKNVLYLAKWSNIPLSEYENYGKDSEGDEDGRSFVQVDMYEGGTADVRDYNDPTGNGVYTSVTGQRIIRGQIPEGSVFAVRYAYLENFQKDGDTLQGFYRYDPVDDGNGGVRYDLYTEQNSSIPLYTADDVNFGATGADDCIYVAKWANVADSDYQAYHPIMGGTGEQPDDGDNGGGEEEVPLGPWVGFDLFGGTARHYPKSFEAENREPDQLEGGEYGVAQLDTKAPQDAVFHTLHGERFIYDVAHRVDSVGFDGWIKFLCDPQNGNKYAYAPGGYDADTNTFETYTTAQVLEMVYDEDVIWVAKWDHISNGTYLDYLTDFGWNIEREDVDLPSLENEGGVWVSIGGRDVTAGYSVTVDDEVHNGSFTGGWGIGRLNRGESIADAGVTNIQESAVFVPAPARPFLGWQVVEYTYRGPVEYTEAVGAEDILAFVIPEDCGENLDIVPVWGDRDSIYYADTGIMPFGGTLVTIDGSTMGAEERFGDRILRGEQGDTIREEYRGSFPAGDPMKAGDEFEGWLRVTYTSEYDENGEVIRDTYDFENHTVLPTTAALGDDTVPTEPDVHVMYMAKWKNVPLEEYEAYFCGGGEEGGDDFTVMPPLAESGDTDVLVGATYVGYTVEREMTDDEGNNPHIETFSFQDMQPWGSAEPGKTLADYGILDITDVSFLPTPERVFLGWQMKYATEEGERVEEFDTVAELLAFPLPAGPVEIIPKFEGSADEYVSEIGFHFMGGTAEDPMGNLMAGSIGGPARKGITMAECFGGENPFAADPAKDNAVFEGWLRLTYTMDDTAGAVYDTTDPTRYTIDEVLAHTVPEEVGLNVVYVAKWSNVPMEIYEQFGTWGELPFFLDGGKVEVMASFRDEEEENESMLLDFADSGLDESVGINLCAALFDDESMIGLSLLENAVIFSEGRVADLTLNASRDLYNFAGWDIYKVTAGEEIRIPEDSVEFPTAGSGQKIAYLGLSEEDEYIFERYTGYTLLKNNADAADVVNLMIDNEVFVVARWDKSVQDEVDVELPSLDLEDEEVPTISVQDDIQLPQYPADPQNPESGPMFSTTEEVKDALNEVVAEVLDRDVSGRDKTVFLEIKLMLVNKVTGESTPVEPENFPDEGLDVCIPFPAGTGRNGFTFVVTHLVSAEVNGYKPGDIEVFREGDYEVTDRGIKIHVHSLSPFAVGWEEVGNSGVGVPPTPQPGGSTAGRPNPGTGVRG